MRAWIVLALAAVGSLGSTGCTFIGLTVGGSTPRYATASSVDGLSPGTDVRITHDGTQTTGTLASSDPDTVRLQGQRSIDRASITKVEKEDGSYWLDGVVVGAGLDAAAITLLALYVSTMKSMWSGSNSSWSWGGGGPW